MPSPWSTTTAAAISRKRGFDRVYGGTADRAGARTVDLQQGQFRPHRRGHGRARHPRREAVGVSGRRSRRRSRPIGRSSSTWSPTSTRWRRPRWRRLQTNQFNCGRFRTVKSDTWPFRSRAGHEIAIIEGSRCLVCAREIWKTDGVTVRTFAIDEHGTGIGSPPAETDDGRVAGAAGGALRLCVVGQLSRHSCCRRRAHRAFARRAAGTSAQGVRDRRPHLCRGRRDRARHVRRRYPRGAAAPASPPRRRSPT